MTAPTEIADVPAATPAEGTSSNESPAPVSAASPPRPEALSRIDIDIQDNQDDDDDESDSDYVTASESESEDIEGDVTACSGVRAVEAFGETLQKGWSAGARPGDASGVMVRW